MFGGTGVYETWTEIAGISLKRINRSAITMIPTLTCNNLSFGPAHDPARVSFDLAPLQTTNDYRAEKNAS